MVVGATSTAKTTTLKNLNKVALHVDAVVPSGDFAITTDTCSGEDLGASSSCSIGATVQSNADRCPQRELDDLRRCGRQPPICRAYWRRNSSNPTFSPISLAFGRVHVGTVSTDKTVTITNPNTLALGDRVDKLRQLRSTWSRIRVGPRFRRAETARYR